MSDCTFMYYFQNNINLHSIYINGFLFDLIYVNASVVSLAVSEMQTCCFSFSGCYSFLPCDI